MKLSLNLFVFVFLAAYSFSFAQMEQYTYKRELKGITEQWHKLALPDELFGKVSQQLSDIRIYGITANNDTIEASYLMRQKNEIISSKAVAFNTLNAAHNQKGYYFTLEIPTTEPINQIKLAFKQQNFDWRLKLEGSQNQQEWFTILNNYRILSIKNELTDFQFTTLKFPDSKYRFFRLLIDSHEKPDLTVASIAQNEIIDGTFRNFPIRQINTKENKQARQTEIDITLSLPARVSQVKIDVTDTFDYYRPLTIKYLVDSFQTEQGWKYNYQTLTSGTLNSLEENAYKFNSKTIQKLKVLIYNQDNQPLSIGAVQVKGYVHEMVVRFTEPATYFLTYGNSEVGPPRYDIDRFSNKIPAPLKAVAFGEEQVIEQAVGPVTIPLFQNKAWLWAIMVVIILLLGWFSVKMIRKE